MLGTWRDRVQAALFALSRPAHVALTAAAGIAVIVLDYLTGPDFSIILFYVLVVAWASWWVGRPAGLAAACAMGFAWAAINVVLFRGAHPGPLPVEIWNALMVLGTFLAAAYALGRLRRSYDEQSALNQRLLHALNEIQVLEGLVPVCAWCKSVRTEGGNWVSIESFLSRQTPAQVTHSICPSCSHRVSE